jgi:hypothetical protein
MRAFTNINAGIVDLNNFSDTAVVRLRVDDAGKFVVFGRVIIVNWDGDSQNASAKLTTLDGLIELDRSDVRISGDGISLSISLQGTLTLPSKDGNNIIDIRCSTFKGLAQEATLFAIDVDEIIKEG